MKYREWAILLKSYTLHFQDKAFSMSGCGYDSSSRHRKDRLRSSCNFSDAFYLKETCRTHIVLIFSLSWSSHDLEVPATDDLRQVAMKLHIKGAVFKRKSSFRQGGRNLKVAEQSLSITPGILSF